MRIIEKIDIDNLKKIINVLDVLYDKQAKGATDHLNKAINITMANKEVKGARAHINEIIKKELKRIEKEKNITKEGELDGVLHQE